MDTVQFEAGARPLMISVSELPLCVVDGCAAL